MIPRRAQLIAFVVLLAGTTWMMVLLGKHGAPLETAGHHRIGALELAPTADAAKTIIDAWTGPLHERALANIRLDYVFIALYSTTLAFAGYIGGVVLRGALGRLGPRLATGMWIAGACDVLENLGMTAELHGRHGLAPLVCGVSTVKWLLVAAGFAYGLLTLVATAVRWRALVEADVNRIERPAGSAARRSA